MAFQFHWRLIEGGETRANALHALRDAPEKALPDLPAQIQFCRAAEQCGIDSLLVDINFGKPDPITLALALCKATTTMKFMVACRPGLMSPTLFVQQVNTFSALMPGRISLNIVAGHSPQEQRYYGDHLTHDERYARMDEFLTICHAFWRDDGPVNFHGKYYTIEDGRLNTPFVSPQAIHPAIYLGGNSPPARDVAMRHATCWMRFADTTERLREQIQPVLDQGKEVGLRLSIITRPTRDEALQAAHALLPSPLIEEKSRRETAFVQGSDSVSIRAAFAQAEQEWLTPWLWMGAVRTHGTTAMALVGMPAEVASGLLAFRDAGISQFILSGWPKQQEMLRFAREVLPLLRTEEQR
jgi:alkanesulfonate monooxygenase